MPTLPRNSFVCDGIATIWYSLFFGLAGRLRHPRSSVYVHQLRRGLDLYHHVLGGSLDRKTSDINQQIETALSTHGGLDLQAWSEPGVLHLPLRINRFPSRELNQELYYWLAGLLAFEIDIPEIASQSPGVRHLLQGVATTSRLIERFPNLKPRYERLCLEELAQRRQAFPDPCADATSPSKTLEMAIRHELGSSTPCTNSTLSRMIHQARTGDVIEVSAEFEYRTIPFLPVPLWSYRAPAVPHLRLPWFKSSRRPRRDGSLQPQRSAYFDLDDRADTASGAAAAPDLYRYSEWNCHTQEYLKNWCRLSEEPPKRGYRSVLDSQFEQMVERVRKQFRQLRFEPQWKRFLDDGTDLDIDAFVSAQADRQGCGIQESRYYREKFRRDRDLSIIVLMDASRSTEAWIGHCRVIDLAKQILAVFAEVFAAASDQFALYTFSSDSRLRVRCGRIKSFDEPYDDEVRQSLLAVKPQNYTRMGPVIRHLGAKLQDCRSTQKLLIILSDGRPHDPTDRYEGKYALEDTRKALLEIRANHVQSFGLTIDQDGLHHLKYLFGRGNYAVCSQFHSLPKALTHLYAQITNLSD